MTHAKTKRRVLTAVTLGSGVMGLIWVLARGHGPYRRAQTEGSSFLEPVGRLPGPSAMASTIAGTIRSEDGHPVAGSRVCAAVPDAPRATACAVSDADGRYRIGPLAGGDYAVVAQADGFRPGSYSEGRAFTLAPSEQRPGVDIVLTHDGVALSGRVVDATGGPIGGAVVRGSTRAGIPVEGLSDAGGRFTLWLGPGMAEVSAEAAGYATARARHVAPSADLLLALTPASRIEGIVVAAATGKPVSGIEVRARSLSRGNPPQPTAVRDADDGSFEIRGLQAGPYELVAQGQGFWGQLADPVRVAVADTSRVKIAVSRALSVAGRVVTRGGAAPQCGGGTVTLSAAGSRSVDGQESVDRSPLATGPRSGTARLVSSVDADGVVGFLAVPQGEYRVTVACPGQLLAEGPVALRVEHDDIQGLTWKVKPGPRLLVHVIDDAGQPVAAARFLVRWPRSAGERGAPDWRGTTDADGRAEIRDGLTPGTYAVLPDAGYDGQPVTVDVPDGEDAVEALLRLAGRGSVDVLVTDGDGNALDSVRVSLVSLRTTRSASDHDGGRGTSVAGAPPPFLGSSRVDAAALGDGHFRAAPLAAGRYRVEVTDGSNGDPQDRPTLVDLDGSSVHVTVVLDRSGRIRGRAADGDGQPLADVWMQASCRAAASDAGVRPPAALTDGNRVLTDAEGRFVLTGIPRGRMCLVRGEMQDGMVAILDDVRASDEVVLTFPTPGAIGGIVRSESGRPVEQFRLWMTEQHTGASLSQTIVPVGERWALANVAPGHWRVHAVSGGASADQRLDLAPGQTMADLLLDFQARMGSPGSGLAKP